jgi:hypothetical protein
LLPLASISGAFRDDDHARAFRESDAGIDEADHPVLHDAGQRQRVPLPSAQVVLNRRGGRIRRQLGRREGRFGGNLLVKRFSRGAARGSIFCIAKSFQ